MFCEEYEAPFFEKRATLAVSLSIRGYERSSESPGKLSFGLWWQQKLRESGCSRREHEVPADWYPAGESAVSGNKEVPDQ